MPPRAPVVVVLGRGRRPEPRHCWPPRPGTEELTVVVADDAEAGAAALEAVPPGARVALFVADELPDPREPGPAVEELCRELTAETQVSRAEGRR